MATTGVNGWHFPSYTDSPDVPRDLGILGNDIAAYIAAHPGADGAQGPRGYSVLNGTNNPISSTGIDGDFYINTTSNSIFGPKTSGAWGSGTSIGGNSVLNGTVDPTSANGSNGDFYINTLSNKIFGPKVNNIWPAGTSLVGPQGNPGTQGTPGTKGDAAATIAVNSTSTGAAGTTASVTNSGSSSNVLLNFTIPRGDKGDTGLTGQNGAPGANANLDPIDTAIGLNIPTTNVFGVNSNWYPRFNNLYSIGQPIDTPNLVTTNRFWKTIYSNTGTINTSDLRLKTNIQDSSLGLNFINSLRPVSYKFIEGSKTEDGTSIPGERTHWGLIAQEVQSVIEDAGVDFGGWVLLDKTDAESEQALRYEEFIAPLIKAVQELTARVKSLEG